VRVQLPLCGSQWDAGNDLVEVCVLTSKRSIGVQKYPASERDKVDQIAVCNTQCL
jgi:5-methylcytosine-specific restriction endonuclease McrA